MTANTYHLDGPPRVPVHLEDVLVEPEPRLVLRDYDYNAGDERKFNLEEAIELARLRAIERGVRQQVRLTEPPTLSGTGPLYLIQDVR